MITGNKIIVKIIKDMEINEINKQLYESAFIQNGELDITKTIRGIHQLMNMN